MEGLNGMSPEGSSFQVRKPTITIRARRSWLPDRPAELWRFRELLVRFAARDITLRYRQTALGVMWVLLVPLMGAGVLSFVFGSVADLSSPPGVPYFLFALAGMVGWTAFAQAVTRTSTVMVGNSVLVSKIYFPRLLLPLSAVVSTMIDVAVSILLLVALLVGYGVNPGLAALSFPVWLLGTFFLALGIGVAAGALMVPYRDVGYILPVAVQFLLFASPVAYELSSVPTSARFLFQANPLTGLLEGMRWSVLGTNRPSYTLMTYSLAVSVTMLVVGMLVFGRMERQFADVI